ncbi:trans-2,3-enoyl-CoA reductase-like isoform X3 [Anguilla anguilla]|uniref:trans-2,3-enoyl-CoA reductase-like isoform X3 n=1 Tax=Anguilla anguilla TaxID=7936 RepID=UPI0015B22CDE|nr:trans-2,3-enoyl-CoA reductase-like isoform X3 [Anguilla anguilla]
MGQRREMSPAKRDPPRTFLSFSQLLLNSGSLGPPLPRPKVSYLEVEILDQRTGTPVSIIDKVHPSSTVLDLKNRFHKACPGWCPSRTGLKTDPNGPFLPDTCVMETIATSSLVSVYPTDLGRQVGWTAVFLSQYFGPLLIYLVFYLRLSNVYADAIKSRRPLVVHLACFCHSLHYIKHLLETLFVHKLCDGCTPLRNLLKGCAFYWGFTAWLGYYVNHPLYTPPCLHPGPTCNPFSWLFKLVHCPQYTYEIGAWISFAIMTQTVPVAVFAALVSTQMLLRARKRRHKYLRRRNGGGGAYRRAAVIPFIL